MISRVGFFLLGLLCLPTAASAAIVNIEYTAHIYNTTGDGLGYQNGDSITGSYVIDTSKADGKYADNPTDVWYYGSLWSGLLQSNFATPVVYGYLDFVRIINDPSRNDQIILDKVLNAFGDSGSVMETLGVGFTFNGLDWISDLSLNGMNFVSDEGGWSNGAFARWSVDLDASSWIMTDSAYFWLDSLKITSETTSVPEPAPLVLLSIVLAGLVVRRRFI